MQSGISIVLDEIYHESQLGSPVEELVLWKEESQPVWCS